MMKKNRLLTYAVVAVFGMFAAACSIDDADVYVLEELGASESEFIVPATAGQIKVEFYANLPGTLAFMEDTPWAALSTDSFAEDGICQITYGENTGFPRKASIEFVTAGNERRDTVNLYQEGRCKPQLSFPRKSEIVYNGKGATRVALNTNIDFDDLKVSTMYSGEDEWVRSVGYEDGTLVIETEDNPMEVDLRNATVQLEYIDGWGKSMKASLVLTQANAQNLLGYEISFEELRSMAAADESVDIAESAYIEAYVVSSKASGNVGENEQITTSTIDYGGYKTTAYVESVDGRYGVCIKTISEADNTIDRYSRVRILLNGKTLVHKSDPDRYEISGVSASDIAWSETVSSSEIPVKMKHIADLSDEDIYTYVTLMDCEFAIRKGSMTPMNERFSNAGNANSISKWPFPVRDIQGSSLYMMTNTTCPYRRDGRMLPNGSGNLSGVIVHEKFRHFVDCDAEDEDDCGNIGRYQIRHMSWEEIDFNQNVDDSFSKLLCEFRYIKGEGRYLATTYGTNGRLIHTYDGYTYKTLGTCAKGIETYCYLGPIGTKEDSFFGKNIGSENGWGVILEDGTDYGVNDTRTNTDGRGRTTAGAYTGWANDYWWDYDNDRPYSWQLEFSTEGISTDVLSLQISALNTSDSFAGPRYWKVEWSDDVDGEWRYIASYVLPQKMLWGAQKFCDLNGFKAMDFKLPLEMLGREKVYLRLTPERNAAANGEEYDSGLINVPYRTTAATNLEGLSSLDYIAVRYNR